jgi:hypothetical protein
MGGGGGCSRARALRGVVLRPELAGLLVCCGLAVVVFGRAWAAPTTSPNGGGVGDGALFLWFLRWTPYAIGHGLNPLFGGHLNVPDGVNLMWNTSLPLPAALMGPVTGSFGLPVTITALYTLALALSAWFASIAFRRYVRSYPAALLGGLVYGFSPAMIAQSSSHLHLTLGAVLPPLMVLLVDDILVGQRGNPLLAGAALGALAAAQVLIGEELLAFTGIACAAMLALLVMFPRRVAGRSGRALVAFGTAAAVFAALAAWPLAFMLVGAALLALLPKVPLPAVPLRPPLFFTSAEVRRIPEGSVALVAPFPSAQASRAMMWQAMADMHYRMPGGYFVGPDAQGMAKFGPVGTRLSGWMTKIRLGWRKPTLVPELRQQLVADLVRWQVGTVVVGPMDSPPTEATMVQFFTELLGRPPEQVAGVWVWWNVRPRSLPGALWGPSQGRAVGTGAGATGPARALGRRTR